MFKKSRKTYSGSQVELLVNHYLECGGEMLELVAGGVGWGLTILYSFEEPLKTIIIREKYVNCWQSEHTIRCYKKMPEKYRVMIDKKLNEYEED